MHVVLSPDPFQCSMLKTGGPRTQSHMIRPRLMPRPHPLSGREGLVDLDKILGPEMDLATELCRPIQIAALVTTV